MKKLIVTLVVLILAGCVRSTTEKIEVEEVVPFETIMKYSSDLEYGQREIETEGVDGLRTVEYEITLVNGEETRRKELSSTILKKPISEVVYVSREKPEETKKESFEPTEDQLRTVQATSQIVLSRNNIEDDTSSQLKNWNIATQEIDDTISWIVTTSTNTHRRIKWIFRWSGKEEDDLLLIYLLVDGVEIINKLHD